MRSLKTPFAVAVTLVLLLGPGALLAQTEKQPQEAEQTGSQTQSDSDKAATADQKAKPAQAKPAQAKSAQAESVKKPAPATRSKQRRFALTFDALKFDMEKTDTFDRAMLTPEINGYHGGKVKIRGYIRPNFKQSGITKFIFVRDNKECCFGPQAAIFDNILVRLEKGDSTNFTVRPVTVEGDFVLKEYYGDDETVWSLYRMYNAKIK